MRRILAGFMIAATSAACAPGATVETGPATAMTPAPPPATADNLPAGTVMQVRLSQTLGTAESQVGEHFTATADLPIVARNGQTVVQQGALIHGTVTGLSAGGPTEPAVIRLSFDRIDIQGRSIPFAANILSADVEAVNGNGERRTIEHAIAGAAAGAILGAIIRGDLGAALPGAAIGAGIGTVISLGTASGDARLPIGTVMSIQTTQHVRIR
jgi:hypothetical protein